MREARRDAPGRVNIIGEHTDYHDGWVLPSAIPQRTTATVRERGDQTVQATSRERPGEQERFTIGEETACGSWIDYVQGLTATLTTEGHALRGFDLELCSDVPVGSGLSSSAALEVSVLRALAILFELRLSDVQIARIAHRAEVEFVGAPVGVMDQMACSLAGEHAALFLDTRTLAFDRIPIPAEIDLVVIDSGVAHQHAGGDYATRRRESDEAAQRLGVAKLRDVPLERLGQVDALPPLLCRRARHVITENGRVLAARDALLGGDALALGRLMAASHLSLRDDYEVSAPAVDRLVELAARDPRVFGARMTGGGFGGAIVALARAGAGRAAGEAIVAQFNEGAHAHATLLVPPV
jgi:galactokinase